MDNWEWWIRVVEIPIIGGIVAWIANTRTQISDHRLHVAEQYAPREEAIEAVAQCQAAIWNKQQSLLGELL